MNWADEKARKLADADAAIQAKNAWQLHEFRVIETQGPEAFSQVSEKIKELANQINRASSVKRFRIESTHDRVAVDSVATPTNSLSLTLDGQLIQVRSFVPYISDKPRCWKMSFRLEDRGIVSISGSVDFERLAESLLDDFIRDLMTVQR